MPAETILVKPGQVKFTISLRNWRFASVNHRLQFGVSLQNQREGDVSTSSQKGIGGPPGSRRNRTVVMVFGPANDVYPQVALLDGTPADIGATTAVEGGQLVLSWTFPAFQQTLVYDPTLAVTDLEVPVLSSAVGVLAASTAGMTLLALFAMHWQHL